MKVNFEIYDLGGNTTALITNRLTDEKCLVVADIIMQQNPEVEQVGMILDVKNDTCIFKMAGGEFCGNEEKKIICLHAKKI